MSRAKLRRRLALLDDLLGYALRSRCQFSLCDGPDAPIRHMRTCQRCACVNRAMKMGLVVKVKEQYVRKTAVGHDSVVERGYPEQFSAVDGSRVC